MVKIQSIKKFNTVVRFGSENVQFDKDGVTEISDELWGEIKGQFPHIFEFGQVPKKSNEVKILETDPREIVELKEKIEYLTRINNELRKAKEQAEKNEKSWRNTVDELLIKNPELSIEESEVEEPTEDMSEVEKFIQKISKCHPKQIPALLAEIGLKAPEDVKTRDGFIKFVEETLSK